MNETELNERIAELERENLELRSRLEPERQKIWVLVWRGCTGDLTADVFTTPDHPLIERLKQRAGPENYVEIHASI